MAYENQAAAETAGWEFYEANGAGEWKAWRRVSRRGMGHGQHEEGVVRQPRGPSREGRGLRRVPSVARLHGLVSVRPPAVRPPGWGDPDRPGRLEMLSGQPEPPVVEPKASAEPARVEDARNRKPPELALT